MFCKTQKEIMRKWDKNKNQYVVLFYIIYNSYKSIL